MKVKIEQLQKQIEDTKKLIEQKNKERNDNYKEMKKVTNSLEKQLENIEKPFNEKRKQLEIEANDLRYKTIPELREQIVKAESEQNQERVMKEGKYDVGTFKTFIEKSLLLHGYLEITEKKTLDNGIQIFRVFDSYNYTEWFAFYGLKCVGFSYRQVGRHRGDETIPFSFIGMIKQNKELMIKKEGKYGGNPYPQRLNFTEWIAILRNKKESLLKEINLNDNEVRKIIGNHEGLY